MIRSPGSGRATVKTLLLTLIIGLSLVSLVGCGGEPTRFEIARKAEEVAPRTQELMIEASFSPEANCRELAAESAEDYEVSAMPYDAAAKEVSASRPAMV